MTLFVTATTSRQSCGKRRAPESCIKREMIAHVNGNLGADLSRGQSGEIKAERYAIHQTRALLNGEIAHQRTTEPCIRSIN